MRDGRRPRLNIVDGPVSRYVSRTHTNIEIIHRFPPLFVIRPQFFFPLLCSHHSARVSLIIHSRTYTRAGTVVVSIPESLDIVSIGNIRRVIITMFFRPLRRPASPRAHSNLVVVRSFNSHRPKAAAPDGFNI